MITSAGGRSAYGGTAPGAERLAIVGGVDLSGRGDDPTTMTSWADVQAAVDRLLGVGDRVLLGIVGPPGAGKSTLAAAVVRYAGPAAVGVPMDGFHLADVELDRLGRRRRKGAIDTFDGHGYVALLARIRAETGHVVYAPTFDRDLEQPVAGAIAVPPTARLVVTEGNWLLDHEPPWGQVAALLDQTWYVHLDDAVRRKRLLARHERFGKSPADARGWEQAVDQPNADRVVSVRDQADRLVDLSAIDLPRTPPGA
jgi:pantothenate kinase